MTSNVLYLVPCFLFACCVTVSAIGDHFEGENGDSNVKFSRVCPSYIYEINKQVKLFKYVIIIWGGQSLEISEIE